MLSPTSRAANIAVDAGFGVLLVVCGLRYFAYHSLSGTGTIVLALAIGCGLSYGVAVLGADQRSIRMRAGLLAATALWLPLVILAPSFGWCAFALFFAVHRVLSGSQALALSAMIVVAVSVGLFLMSSGQDLGLVLGPFFGGLVLAYAYWALDRSLAQQRELNRELIEAREQLAATERAAGAAEERERVASELHDTVAQRTAEALLLMEAEHASDASSAASGEARQALRRALGETREFMLGLVDPRTQAPASLPQALRQLAKERGAEFEIAGSERPLPEDIEHALQRVAQEALTNAHRHANAAVMRVTLTYFPDAVGVDIADDGDGFAPEAPAGDGSTSGFGLRALKWRVSSVGGSATIESTPGHGTVVAAIVPLETP